MCNSFAELGLNEQILAGVEALGFTTPTPVQAQAIPAVLEGRDVVASAQTGTGKTAAFALPILQRIAPASRAAREELVRQVPANADSDASSDVQLDAIPQDFLSVPVPPDSSAPDNGSDGSGSGGSTPTEAAPVESGATGDAPDGATDKPKRRRRRHHRKAPSTSASDKVDAVESDNNDNGGDNDGKGNAPGAADATAQTTDSSPTPRRRRRKKHARSSSAGSAPVQASPESSSPAPPSPAPSSPEASSEGPRPVDDKPKRRRRKRKKKPVDATATDSRKANPNAHPFGPFALVVTPTRELAQQIDRVVSVVCEYTNQRAVIVMGGAKFERQIRSLEEGCDMLVATPGRLIDLMEHDHVDLSHVQVLVLDEADRMLDMGFWPSVRRILAALPSSRQNLLFSATIPPSIQSTIDAMLHDPVRVEIARVGETAETVEEHLCPVTQGQKTQLLQELIRRTAAVDIAHADDVANGTDATSTDGTTGAGDATDGATDTGDAADSPADAGTAAGPTRVLVFCRTKQRVDDVSRTLKNAGFSVDVMHADRPQKARERALAKFRAGKCQVLVATDVMSRGIDVSGIDAVVNFDVPLDPEDYVHRIGRTGRAGATGQAYTFVAPDEVSPLREIEYFTSSLIPTWDLPGFAYDEGRIVPSATRSTVKPKRTMFSGMRSRGRGMYGRHY